MKPIEAKLPFSCSYIDVQNDVSLLENLNQSGILKGIANPKATCTADKTNNIPVLIDEKDLDQLILNLHRYTAPNGNNDVYCYFSSQGAPVICTPKGFFDDENGPFKLWAKGPKIKERMEAIQGQKSGPVNQFPQAVPIKNQDYSGSVEGGSYQFDFALTTEAAALMETLMRQHHDDPDFFVMKEIYIPDPQSEKMIYQMRYSVRAVKAVLQTIKQAEELVGNAEITDPKIKTAKALLQMLTLNGGQVDDLKEELEALLSKPGKNLSFKTEAPTSSTEVIYLILGVLGLLSFPVVILWQDRKQQVRMEKMREDDRNHYDAKEEVYRQRQELLQREANELQLRLLEISMESNEFERGRMIREWKIRQLLDGGIVVQDPIEPTAADNPPESQPTPIEIERQAAEERERNLRLAFNDIWDVRFQSDAFVHEVFMEVDPRLADFYDARIAVSVEFAGDIIRQIPPDVVRDYFMERKGQFAGERAGAVAFDLIERWAIAEGIQIADGGARELFIERIEPNTRPLRSVSFDEKSRVEERKRRMTENRAPEGPRYR